MNGVAKPLISVVITNHNYGRFLEQTIGSALSQQHVRVEVIVVDNGSTDNSRHVIEEYCDQIKSIFQGDVGQARGRNAGIANARGDLIAFMDADDYWEPNKLSAQLTLISPSIEFVYCGIRQFDSASGATLRTLVPRFMGDCRRAFVDFPNLAIVPAGESCSLITRHLIERIGGFDETLSGATGRDFFRRCSAATQFAAVPDLLVNYRLHSSNFSKSTKSVMDDTELAYKRLFSDPDWAFALPLRKSCIRKLQWSFFKTNLKANELREATRNLRKILGSLFGLRGDNLVDHS
jgi:glycosyltransferase involved in cell wall biosynthesis